MSRESDSNREGDKVHFALFGGDDIYMCHGGWDDLYALYDTYRESRDAVRDDWQWWTIVDLDERRKVAYWSMLVDYGHYELAHEPEDM